MKFQSVILATALMSVPAPAAVTDLASNGFTIGQTRMIAAPPAKVFAILVVPGRWWSSEHTFSGSAANMSIDARAGGCFCETLPGSGSVQHLVVVNVRPGEFLRLQGMLGPFQAVAGIGVLTFSLAPDAAGTRLEMTYQVAGYANMKIAGKGYDAMSKAADGMLSDQLDRLKRAVETGSAEP